MYSVLSCRQIYLTTGKYPYTCLLGAFSGRYIKASSKKRGALYLASYLNPASCLNITHKIVDRLFNAYQTDIPRKVDLVDEVECWKSR
jgi:hypothetical protein